MRCLLIAPADVNVSVLTSVLVDQGIEVVSASDLGAGVTLAQSALDLVDWAVAVLPSQSAQGWDGFAAILIEIGVAAGRGVPLLVIAEPPDQPPPALAGVTIVRTPIDHVDALRLHLRMFMLAVASAGTRRPPRSAPVVLAPSSLADLRARLDMIRSSRQVADMSRGPVPTNRGELLERLVYEILSEAGAVLAINVELSRNREADAVAYVPGTESVLGTIIVEVKLRRLTQVDLRRTEQQLMASMMAGRAGFGLLVYDDLMADAREVRTTPFMLALSIDELLTQLEHTSLSDLLLRARNRAVHGAGLP